MDIFKNAAMPKCKIQRPTSPYDTIDDGTYYITPQRISWTIVEHHLPPVVLNIFSLASSRAIV